MRYFDTNTSTEAIPGLHFSEDGIPAHIKALPDNNPFFNAIPAGMQLTYDEHGVPNGLEVMSVSIGDARTTKHTDINTWRDQQELATVEFNGQHWDADPTSRARIESVLLAGAMPLDYWTDASNQDQPMTLDQLRALYAAIVQQGGRIHDRQRTMKAKVNALNTIEEVQAYPVGWAVEVTP